jgi:hypothetical protein
MESISQTSTLLLSPVEGGVVNRVLLTLTTITHHHSLALRIIRRIQKSVIIDLGLPVKNDFLDSSRLPDILFLPCTLELSGSNEVANILPTTLYQHIEISYKDSSALIGE